MRTAPPPKRDIGLFNPERLEVAYASPQPLFGGDAHRLVSLWDIISMYALQASRLIEACNWLASVQQKLAGPNTSGPAEAITCETEVVDKLRICAAFIRSTAEELELKGLVSAAERLGAVIASASKDVPRAGLSTYALPDAARLFTNLRLVHGRVPDDFADCTVLVIPLNKREYYRPDPPEFGAQFGPDVAQKFSTRGQNEVGEAANCLALGRETACAFHLMRAVETVLDAATVCLQLPPPKNRRNKTWGAVLTRFKDELAGRENLAYVRQWSSKSDRAVFAELYGSLVAIKDAWRDPTMHLERSFNEREARHLFELVKGFMQKAASRLDENGLPLA